MKQQRNMFQAKERDKIPEEELSEVGIGNLPKIEFRVMMSITGCRFFPFITLNMWCHSLLACRRMDAQSEKLEVFNKKLENIKNNQTEMKNTITEMKNKLEGINSRLNDTEEWMSELED